MPFDTHSSYGYQGHGSALSFELVSSDTSFVDTQRGTLDRTQTQPSPLHPKISFRVCMVSRMRITIIIVAFVIRQSAAWASTLIIHKHSPKEETQGKSKNIQQEQRNGMSLKAVVFYLNPRPDDGQYTRTHFLGRLFRDPGRQEKHTHPRSRARRRALPFWAASDTIYSIILAYVRLPLTNATIKVPGSSLWLFFSSTIGTEELLNHSCFTV